MNRNTKTALIIGGVVLVLLIAIPQIWGGFSGWQGGMMGGGMMGGGMMGGWGWFMPIIALLFWALPIWLLVLLIQGLSQPRGPEPGPRERNSALELLKQRYARGEISKEEYEEKKGDLA